MPDALAAEFPRRRQAQERSLVVLAQGIPCEVVREEGRYLLLVPEEHLVTARRELALYERERYEEKRRRRQRLPPPPFAKASLGSLFAYGWVLAAFFIIQSVSGPSWTRLGLVSSSVMEKGEWWRVVTALTLHSDLKHLLANLAVGLVFAASLLPWLGIGWVWFGFVLSGALGNALNVVVYGAGSSHQAIGASTAVFGALGMLVGWQVAALIRRQQTQWRVLLIPLAAGIALFAFLGIGGEESNIDVMGHLWGMVAGSLLGLILGGADLPQKTGLVGQRLLAGVALLLPWLCWWVALTQ